MGTTNPCVWAVMSLLAYGSCCLADSFACQMLSALLYMLAHAPSACAEFLCCVKAAPPEIEGPHWFSGPVQPSEELGWPSCICCARYSASELLC